jgi:hypothetical protein
VLDGWSIENSWHWPRDTQLREDAHRYREVNGVQIMATLRSLAMIWPPWLTTSGVYWHCWAGENLLSHRPLSNF